jgi:hypothetical protein
MSQKKIRQTGEILFRCLKLGKLLAAFRFRWACPSGATTELLPKDRTTHAPCHSFRIVFAGSWPVLIPTGASPVEI